MTIRQRLVAGGNAMRIGLVLLVLAATGCQRQLFDPPPAPARGAPISLCRDAPNAACGEGELDVCGAQRRRPDNCAQAVCPPTDHWQTFDDVCTACGTAGVWRYAEGSCVGD